MKCNWKALILQILVFSALYVVLGNARSVQPNPFIPGATIALNMIIPVIAGILFGRWAGLGSGLFGTLLGAISPAGSVFEFAAIIPHALMGFTAGLYHKRFTTPILALALLIGHALNLLSFTLFRLIDSTLFTTRAFWFGIAYESFLGIIAVIIIVAIYQSTFGGKYGAYHKS